MTYAYSLHSVSVGSRLCSRQTENGAGEKKKRVKILCICGGHVN